MNASENWLQLLESSSSEIIGDACFEFSLIKNQSHKIENLVDLDTLYGTSNFPSWISTSGHNECYAYSYF